MNTQIPAEGPPMIVTPILGEIAFRPFYTPMAMLNFGIRGGTFGNDNLPLAYSISDELTRAFKGTSKWGLSVYDNSKNHFNVEYHASERDLSGNQVFKAKHPLGWFEWYARFYYGAKSTADVFRVAQWYVGINTAWFYIKTGAAGNAALLTDVTYLPIRRQALLEWGVDPTLDPVSYGCGHAF